jgi:hypothetical protein
MWLQCDMFFYGRINLAKPLPAAARRRGSAMQAPRAPGGKQFVYAAACLSTFGAML